MKLQELQQLYPNALLQSFPTNDPAFLSLAVSSNFLWIPKADLSRTEEQLLVSLFQEKQPNSTLKKHPWYPALYEKQKPPIEQGNFRIIQVAFNRKNLTNLNDWNHEIQNMLPFVSDHFFINENRCLLIEAFSEEALLPEELEGLFLALDGDFDTYTRLFIGSFYSYNSEFTLLLQEEEELFNHALQSKNQSKVFTLGQLVVEHFSNQTTKKSYMMNQLYTTWFEEDIAQIIESLWENQGNVSSAAKKMFMHRNTLQYKIEKFQKRTLTNLKNMNHLFLCYLLLISFHNH